MLLTKLTAFTLHPSINNVIGFKGCVMIPDVINETHDIHITPCYKKFTLILTKNQTNLENIASKERRSSSRQACSSSSSNWVYPEECNFCHKYKLQHTGRSIFPAQVSTINAERTINLQLKNVTLIYSLKFNILTLSSKNSTY